MYKGSILKKRSIGVIFTLLMLGAIESQAQCLVGGTDFETSTTLCNPQLANDETGWFSDDPDVLANEIAGCGESQESLGHVIQKGLQSNLMNTTSTFFTNTNAWTIENTRGDANQGTTGYLAVMANPKLLDPILSEGNGTNMLVNAGTANSQAYFMSYSVSGLTPNSNVELTMTAYYLVDKASVVAAQEAAQKNVVTYLGGDIRYQADTKGFQAQSTNITWGTALQWGSVPTTDAITLTSNDTNGKLVSLKGKADANGNITFYFGRGSKGNFPIGIDNIEITGEVKPEISFYGNPCPLMPASINLKQKYPAGTTYQWEESTTGEKATTQSFDFTPPSADKYNFTCTVTLPGCTPVKSEPFALEVEPCCEDGNGNAMAKKNIYMNDFGSFSGTSYTYLDKLGMPVTVTATDKMDCGAGGIPTIDDLLGSISASIPYNSNFCQGGGYNISTKDPYAKQVEDQSKPGIGGFMMMDLKTVDKSPVFEKRIEGVCPKRQLYFNVDVSSINTENPSNVDLLVEIIETRTGNVIKDGRWEHKLGNIIQWEHDYLEFQVEEETDLILRMTASHPKGYATYDNGEGDFAIDNIFLQVCSPPDITVDYQLSGNATDLLDLCTGDVLTLQATNTSAANNFYGAEIGYMFQYTHDNPKTTDADQINWITMKNDQGQEITDSKDFIINEPANHVAFKAIQDEAEAEVYFRIVAGKKSVLQDPDELKVDAQSPCRNISISTMWVTASLNCAKCYQSGPIGIYGDIASTKKENGYDVYELCYGETLRLNTEDVTTVDKDGKSYADYTFHWYENQKTTPMTDMSVSPAAQAKELVITNDNISKTATEVWYYAQTVDNFDATATNCQNWDTVKVILHPKPAKPSITIPNFCAGTTAPTVAEVQSQVQGYTINWKTDAGLEGVEPNFATITPGTTASFYLSVTDAATGCESDTASFSVTVDTIPSEVLEDITPFCEGDETAMLPTSAKGYTVAWTGNTTLSTVQGSTTPQSYTYTLTDPKTGCVSGNLPYTFTVMPKIKLEIEEKNVCDTTYLIAKELDPSTASISWNDAIKSAPLIITDSSSVIQYEIFASQSDYCNSDTITITPIFEVTPKTVATKSNVVKYLKVNGQAGFVSSLLTDSIIQSGNDVYWSKANGPFDVVPTIPSVPSDYTAGASTSLQLPSVDFSDVKDQHYYYWVYQQSAFGCVSEPISILLSVLGAPAPDVKSFEYCINSEDKDVNPFTASATFSKQSLPNVSYELVFYKDVNKTTIIDTLLTPKPDVTTVGKVTYYVTQRDKNNHNNESTPMPFDITVYDVADLTPEKVVEYCVSQAGNASEIDVKIGAGSTYVKSESSYYWGTSESDISNLSSDGKAVPSFTNSDTLTYYFQPYYEIKDKTGANVLQVCKGDIDSTKVQIYETKPATTTTIQYIAKESKDGKTFPILTEKEEWTEDSDFDYYYSPLVDTNTQPANLSSYSKGAPKPSCDVSTLNGQTKTFYTWVYRINTKNPKDCPSEPVMLTINISDAVSPIVKPYFVCQGASLTSIEATINTQVKSASEYILKWYGTNENAVIPEKEDVTSFDITLDSSKEGEVTYYVTQYDKGTKAESPKTPIKITILANPITKVTPPAKVCEKEVDLATTWEVTNVTDALTTGYLNGATELASSKVTESGTYTITNKYVNDYSKIGAISVTPQTTPGYCVGNPVDVTVTIDTLSTPLISGSLTACPGIQEELKVSAISNVASISYSWDGAITATGDKIMGGTTGSTKGQTFTYTVTATAGTCTETSDTHTITVGDGPVEGLMTATETDNSLSQFKFTDDNGGQERVVYACGNELTLEVNYNNTNSAANTEFTWYDGATSIGTGASIQIPATTTPATKTYEVKYFNKCAASAKVTVHFVPLGIDPTLAEKPLTLCEGNQFNAKFEHNSSAILQPSIKWFKGGVEISGQTTNQFTIPSTTSANNGKYGFEISFKGCKESVTLYDLTVIPAISVKLPATPTICEGEEVDLEVTNIQPQGTTVSWQADATIVSGANSSKATVKPTYTGGASHQAEYVYTAVAFNSICNSTEKYPVKVLVDEALSGSISGRNAICENESTTLNATAYDASTYTWKEGATVLAQSGVVTVKPLVTTTYEIEMTRGKCSATDNYMVEVTTNPVIVSVDSVGIRDRQVITATDKGTAPFEFWVDENSANASVDDIFKNLTFTTHVAHIKDINGCQTSYQFSLEPPAISVPEFFTPNGDGVNDNWVVGSLAEVYPGAVVTIFDRFGKTLIQFLGADADGWDGTYKGVPMPSTDYWYMIDIEEIDKQYSGHFTLMRR